MLKRLFCKHEYIELARTTDCGGEIIGYGCPLCGKVKVGGDRFWSAPVCRSVKIETQGKINKIIKQK